MLFLLFLLSVSSVPCYSQQYLGLPAYSIRRPVRRSAIEALEHMRLPVARYFPQVDGPLSPYRGALPSYPVGDLYALPPQWTADEEPDYEYEVYRAPPEEVYPQEAEMGNPDLYNDLMSSYLMGVPEEQQPLYEKRRGEPLEETMTMPSESTQQQVQMTAVPAAPEKKNVQSLIVPDVAPEAADDPREGQKEEPLFRPLQNSQRTTWSQSHSVSAQQKTPIPLLKQMIQSQKKKQDPLTEELNSLKQKKP